MIGMLSLFSSVALADSAEEFARANKLLSVENMMDGLVVMRKLAVQNYAPAQAVLGEFLDFSEEDEEAVGWYMMAANQGDAAGEFGLGSMYQKGEGIKKDPEKALYWIKRAFEKDNINAVRLMASAYKTGPEKSGLPVAVDLAQAKLLAEKVKAYDDAAKKAADAVLDENAKRVREERERKAKEAK